MNITRLALEKTRVTVVSLLLLIAAGISAYQDMPRNEDPGFVIRTALVRTPFPGASPERVEQLVTDKLEKVIQEIPQIDYVSSESKTGVSLIFVNIKESYSEMRPIWDDLRRKVDSARSELPEGIRGPFVDDEFGDVFGIIIGLTGEGYDYAELKKIADEVRDELLTLGEVAKVEIQGAQEERIFVEFDNARLAETGISPGQLQTILENRNIIIPGGEVFTEAEQITLEPTGNFESVEDLRKTVVKLPGSTDVVYLQDLVDIKRGYIDPAKSKFHYNGRPGLSISINMRAGGNVLTLGEQVRDKLAFFLENYPIGIDFNAFAFQPEHVDKKIADFEGNIVQAILIVLAVMLLTLGLRTGLVVASLIPMAMVTAILVMSVFDIGLDQMSLASLIIALGMLVDNAIVMSESIMTQMEEGKPARQAAIDSANELKIPLLTSSLTTAAAFLPIFLAESSTGEYTAPLFKVVTITLLSSWLLALTMTPLLCVRYLKVKKGQQDSLDTPFYRRYRGVLLALLRHPWLSTAGVAVIWWVAMQGFQFVPSIFFPPNDKAIMQMEIALPIGTPLARTEQVVSEIESYIAADLMAGEGRAGITEFASYIGVGAPRFVLNYNPEQSSPEVAFILMNTSDRDVIDTELVPALDSFVFQNYPEVTARTTPLQMGSPVDSPIEIRVSGKDKERIFSLVESIKARMARTPGIKNIKDDWGMQTKKLLVKVDQPRALRAGLTSRDIAVSLQTILSGIQTTEYREGDQAIPVTLRSSAADRQDIGKLEGHQIYVQSSGRNVPLNQVADIEIVWQPAKILRRDRLKTVAVQADAAAGANSQELARELNAWLREESRAWPLGYKYELGGEVESSGKANKSIGAKLPIAALIIILLLVGQFNSIRRPLIIMITIPLGLIGVVVGLLVARSYFGFMTLLGVISLAGIVINNAIVLLDRIRIEIDDNGMSPQEAIVSSAQKRLRPILLTTATTVGGLIPLWLGGGPMWEPMAISIIFGLIFATVLTLGVVPVLYALFFRVRFEHQ
ncbi:MAG: efflux RND transporter permease subunit [Candidatus Omnitrophica bacterium]|nr:efflux RND transporter permease subunit [Candidatus Omnitrophota bacterium]MCB9720017.1 efflux RND transporter permease subunit [Candidatus Omnitrophota bacterium]